MKCLNASKQDSWMLMQMMQKKQNNIGYTFKHVFSVSETSNTVSSVTYN